MSAFVRYRNGVRHWLITTHKWPSARAKNWCAHNINYIRDVFNRSINAYEAARLINEKENNAEQGNANEINNSSENA